MQSEVSYANLILVSAFLASCNNTSSGRDKELESSVIENPVLLIFLEFCNDDLELYNGRNVVLSEEICFDRDDTTGISKKIYVDRGDFRDITVTINEIAFSYNSLPSEEVVAVSFLKMGQGSEFEVNVTFHTEPLEIA